MLISSQRAGVGSGSVIAALTFRARGGSGRRRLRLVTRDSVRDGGARAKPGGARDADSSSRFPLMAASGCRHKKRPVERQCARGCGGGEGELDARAMHRRSRDGGNGSGGWQIAEVGATRSGQAVADPEEMTEVMRMEWASASALIVGQRC